MYRGGVMGWWWWREMSVVVVKVMGVAGVYEISVDVDATRLWWGWWWEEFI